MMVGGCDDDIFAEVVVHARLLLTTCWIRLVAHSAGHISVCFHLVIDLVFSTSRFLHHPVGFDFGFPT